MPRPRAPKDRIRIARLAGAVVLLIVATASCGSSDDTAGAGASPTFEKVSEESFRYPEPVATVSDLVAPAGEGALWHIVGSVLDPGTGRTRGAVWQSGDGQGWEEIEVEPEDRKVSEQMRAAAHVGDQLMAVGSAGQGDEADAVVWRSEGSEGADWTPMAPEDMAGKHEQWAFDIAAGDGGVVVVGGERAWGDVRPRVWHSTDGEAWQTVDGGSEGPFAQSGQASISSVTAFGEGFVAVGWERVDGQQNGLAWYSPDGTNWEAIDAPSLGGDGRQALLSVATADGRVVAGGYSAGGAGQGQPVVWRSEDGISWGEASEPLELADSRLTTASDLMVQSLDVHDSTLYASGGARARPHMWRSSDAGRTWEALPQPSASRFPDGVELVDTATDGSSTVAIGSEPLVMRLGDDDRWLSTTGDAFPNGGSKPVATSVVIDGDVTLVGGYHLRAQQDDQPQRYQAHVWRRDGNGDFSVIGPPAEEGGEAEDGGGEEGEEGESEGDDQPTDEEALIQGFDAGAIEAMAAYEDGYVAVGVEDFSVAEKRTLEDRSPDGMLWLSPDGEQWQRYAATPPQANQEEWAQIMADQLGDYSPDELAQAVVATQADEPWSSQAPAGGQGTRSLRGVSPIANGFITVGSAFREDDIDPIVAVSPSNEGIKAEDAGLKGQGTQRFNDVCSIGDRAIAVGATGSEGPLDTAIYYRKAGDWQAASATDDSFSSRGNQQAMACAVSEEGFIAVGLDDSSGVSNAKIWLSEDGLEWEELVSGALGGSGEQEATAVAAVPDGGWLVGGTDTSGSDAGIALWRLTPDGELSRRDLGESALSGSVPMEVADLAVTSERTVVVGADVEGIGVWETKTSDLDR